MTQECLTVKTRDDDNSFNSEEDYKCGMRQELSLFLFYTFLKPKAKMAHFTGKCDRSAQNGKKMGNIAK